MTNQLCCLSAVSYHSICHQNFFLQMLKYSCGYAFKIYENLLNDEFLLNLVKVETKAQLKVHKSYKHGLGKQMKVNHVGEDHQSQTSIKTLTRWMNESNIHWNYSNSFKEWFAVCRFVAFLKKRITFVNKITPSNRITKETLLTNDNDLKCVSIGDKKWLCA